MPIERNLKMCKDRNKELNKIIENYLEYENRQIDNHMRKSKKQMIFIMICFLLVVIFWIYLEVYLIPGMLGQ